MWTGHYKGERRDVKAFNDHFDKGMREFIREDARVNKLPESYVRMRLHDYPVSHHPNDRKPHSHYAPGTKAFRKKGRERFKTGRKQK